MKLFRKIHFSQPDPLGAGLAEEIAAERSEPDAISLDESPSGDVLSRQWAVVVDELHDDPTWVDFAKDED